MERSIVRVMSGIWARKCSETMNPTKTAKQMNSALMAFFTDGSPISETAI